ncbi:MAG: K(+)-transporting ATPase subunit F [Thermomicrobiales bacterium]
MDANNTVQSTDRAEEQDEGWLVQQNQLDGLDDVNWFWKYEEDESMSFGEAVTLLIAIGVLIYLVYALLWPERF